MMSETLAGTVLRMQRDREYQGKPKGYKHTYRGVPEGDGEPWFSCDVVGHTAHHEIRFLDSAGRPAFSMRPNRKIMPTHWLVEDSSGRDLGRIVQKILGKGAWAAFDASGAEVFRVADAEPRVDKVGRALFGGSSSKYRIVQADRLAATTETEPRAKTTKKGIRGFLQAFTIPSDWVIRFSADAPELDIRLVVVAMILLIDLTVTMDAVD